MEAGYSLSDLNDKIAENTQSKEQIVKTIQKKEDSLGASGATLVHQHSLVNICVTINFLQN